MKQIIIILIACSVLFGQTLETRKRGGTETDGIFPSQYFSKVGSAIHPFYEGFLQKLTVDSAIITNIYFPEYAGIGAIQSSLVPNYGQAYLGTFANPFPSGVVNDLYTNKSFELSENTYNVKSYDGIQTAIDALPDSDAVLYFPPGDYYLDGTMCFYGKKRIKVILAPNAKIMPGYPMSSGFSIAITDTIVEGETSAVLNTGDSDFSSVHVGMTFRNLANAAGKSGVANVEPYRITSVNTFTGAITFTPAWDGDDSTGTLSYSSYGFDSYGYYPPPDYTDTLFATGTLQFNGIGAIFFGRGSELCEVIGGMWTEKRDNEATIPYGFAHGDYGIIMSHYTKGFSVSKTFINYSSKDGISPQFDNVGVRIFDNIIHNTGRYAIHLGAQQKNAVVMNNFTYNCAAGLYYCLDIENSQIIGNLFINNDPDDNGNAAIHGYGDQFNLGEHYHFIAHNVITGGQTAIDVGLQAGDLYFTNNIVANMKLHGISVGDTSFTSGNAKGMWNVHVKDNIVFNNNGAGIYFQSHTTGLIESGSIKGNTCFNNGINANSVFDSKYLSGIYIDPNDAEKVLVSENHCYNVPDSSGFTNNYHVGQGNFTATQRYGIYVDGTDVTNIYRDNQAYNNTTENFHIVLGLPVVGDFRTYSAPAGFNKFPWEPGTTRFNSADSTLYIWRKSGWTAVH